MTPRRFHGAAARELRKRSGVRRTDMAGALGCTPRWVSRIESGTGTPSTETVALYAHRLGVPLDSLLVAAAGVVPGPRRSPEAATVEPAA